MPASIEYQAAVEILEALDAAIMRTGGRVSMRRAELFCDRVIQFEYTSCSMKNGKRYAASETVPWIVLRHLRTPAAFGTATAERWIAETHAAADAEAAKRKKGTQ